MNTEISKSNICRRALLMIAAGRALASAAVAANASEVKVSSFGYDSEDSTEFIQKALASGASTVIIDKQAGDWINWGLIGVGP